MCNSSRTGGGGDGTARAGAYVHGWRERGVMWPGENSSLINAVPQHQCPAVHCGTAGLINLSGFPHPIPHPHPLQLAAAAMRLSQNPPPQEEHTHTHTQIASSRSLHSQASHRKGVWTSSQSYGLAHFPQGCRFKSKSQTLPHRSGSIQCSARYNKNRQSLFLGSQSLRGRINKL